MCIGDTLKWNSIGITILGNGSSGTALNQLNTPWDVFIDVNDIIYIADSSNHRILNVTLMNNESNYGTVIAGITNVSGSNAMTLNTPCAIYIDSEKNLYIADTANHRVQFWEYGSSNGSTVAGSSAGLFGNTLDKLGDDYALYVDQSKNIYVSDGSNGRIVKWIPGASSGILIAGANGSTGYSSNQLALPLGITVDTQTGIIYIADFYAQTIVAWTSYMTSGTVIIGTNSTHGNTVSLLNYPFGIIRDVYGNIYVSDYNNHRVQMYCAVGSSFTNGTTIAGVGVAQFSSFGLNGPTGIAFDSQMNLYVADANNHRIQKFARIQ
jgi:sugar lactone lactonase YvrE